MESRQIYINGSYHKSNSDKWLEVENPATKQIIARVPRSNAEDVNQAVAAASAAFPKWSASPVSERIAIMKRFHDYLRADKEQIIASIQSELGCPTWFCEQGQFGGQLEQISHDIEIAATFEFEQKTDGYTLAYEPVGVVAALTPWNYPLSQIIKKVIPALLAGNTVVHKPSQHTPLSAYHVVEALQKAGLPAGVYNLVTGRGSEVGNSLATHPLVDMISFTGSTAGGKEVSKLAADSLKRVSLELGGKSAAIFLDDTNLATHVEIALNSIFSNSGQSCAALSRFVVVKGVKEQLESEIRKIFDRYTAGNPLQDPFMGSLATDKQFAKVSQYIQDGKERLDVLIGSGSCDDSEGYFCSPIIFTNVDENDRLAQEEIFGPVAVIIEAEDEDDAVRIANNSKYGLSGAVFGEKESALQVAKQIRAGQVKINQAHSFGTAPFGGYKQSGNTREGGLPGFKGFLEMKVIFAE